LTWSKTRRRPVLAEIVEHRLRRAPAERRERVEVAVRDARECFAKQLLGVLGQVREAELLARALELDEVVRELDAIGGVDLDRELEKDRRIARIAAVHDAHLARACRHELVVLRNGNGCDVRVNLAGRTHEREAAFLS
jgi:ABC-type hemin transport system ATPase subunit